MHVGIHVPMHVCTYVCRYTCMYDTMATRKTNLQEERRVGKRPGRCLIVVVIVVIVVVVVIIISNYSSTELLAFAALWLLCPLPLWCPF